MRRRSGLPGPEWNPVLAVIAVLAGLLVLATISPALGLVGIGAVFFGACVYAFMVTP